jgi:hypothetical protein
MHSTSSCRLWYWYKFYMEKIYSYSDKYNPTELMGLVQVLQKIDFIYRKKIHVLFWYKFYREKIYVYRNMYQLYLKTFFLHRKHLFSFSKIF